MEIVNYRNIFAIREVLLKLTVFISLLINMFNIEIQQNIIHKVTLVLSHYKYFDYHLRLRFQLFGIQYRNLISIICECHCEILLQLLSIL